MASWIRGQLRVDDNEVSDRHETIGILASSSFIYAILWFGIIRAGFKVLPIEYSILRTQWNISNFRVVQTVVLKRYAIC